MTEAEPKPPSAAAPPAFKMPQKEDRPDEFAHIPGRGNRPPILALMAVALAVFLAVRLRHDVRYAFSSAVPTDLGQARSLAGQPLDALPLNRYVGCRARPNGRAPSSWTPAARGSSPSSSGCAKPGAGCSSSARRSVAGVAGRAGSLHRPVVAVFGPVVRRVHLASLRQRRGRHPVFPARGPVARPDRADLPPSAKLFVDVLRPGQYQVQLPRLRFADRAGRPEGAGGAGGPRAARVPRCGRIPIACWLEIEVPEASPGSRAVGHRRSWTGPSGCARLARRWR